MLCPTNHGLDHLLQDEMEDNTNNENKNETESMAFKSSEYINEKDEKGFGHIAVTSASSMTL